VKGEHLTTALALLLAAALPSGGQTVPEPAAGAAVVNSLGMPFVPIKGTKVLKETKALREIKVLREIRASKVTLDTLVQQDLVVDLLDQQVLKEPPG